MLGKFALIYMLMVVYGSLVPLEWNGLAVEKAWENFQRIPLLTLGVGSRADWVANIVLYVPLGFLLCGWLTGESRRALVKSLGAGLSTLICLVFAISVEFAQEFFPPRTVSLNDLYAESLGSVTGIGLWLVAGIRLRQLTRTVFHGGNVARNSALYVYALAYLALSAFPFDFLVSAAEWREHLDSGRVGWLFAEDCGGRCVVKLLPETLAAIPLGVLATILFGGRRPLSTAVAFVSGLMLGVGIEAVQLTMASGVSQGVSVISRGVGVALGAYLVSVCANIELARFRHYVRSAILLATVPYLVALAWLNRWFSGDWLALPAGLGRLPDTHFLPFYYHYYTSEAVALVSLLYQFGLYLPIGLAVWTWRWVDRTQGRDLALATPLAIGTTLAVVIETGKLFLSGEHPDPTNVLIAIASVTLVYHLLTLVSAQARVEPPSVATSIEKQATTETVVGSTNPRPLWAWILAVPALGAAAIATITNPIGALAAIALLVYAVALWWRPNLWLIFVLALLPLLDFTPWSGRLFWTDFDTLLLFTLGIGYWRLPMDSEPGATLPRLAKVFLVLFGITALIAFVNGLLPMAPLDLNAFSHYMSSYNALRAAKPFFFALAFLPLLLHEWGNPERAAGRLALGATLGLAAEVIIILWERVTFSGLFNFETDYRITGSFPGMHVGGAYVEAYLVMMLPFVVLWAWQQRSILSTVLAIGLYAAGAYGVMVTFSRGGQAAFALATFIALAGFVRLTWTDRAHRPILGFFLVATCAVTVLVTWPIIGGKFSQARLAASGQDFATRTSHWADAINILKNRGETVFGAGFGTYPAAYFWGSGEPKRPSTYSFASTSNGSTFLRMGSGESLYIEQIVGVEPNRRYTLNLEARSTNPSATVTVSVCEKALLYSFTCAYNQFPITGSNNEWQAFEVVIDTIRFGPPESLFLRPVKVSIFNAQSNTVFELRKIALTDNSGENLVQNGNFAAGMHHWFFSTDNQLPWHIENLFVHVFFEQGLIGLIVFLGFVIYVLAHLLRQISSADAASVALLASFTGFLAVGLFNTLVDETRIGFLFFFLMFSAFLVGSGPKDSSIRRSV